MQLPLNENWFNADTVTQSHSLDRIRLGSIIGISRSVADGPVLLMAIKTQPWFQSNRIYQAALFYSLRGRRHLEKMLIFHTHHQLHWQSMSKSIWVREREGRGGQGGDTVYGR